jgi:yeast amino acid transporter
MFITSGAIIGISGSVGAPLSYLIAGFIVSCVIYTLSEMVTCRPLTGALIDFPNTFVDQALGFAVCLSYL